MDLGEGHERGTLLVWGGAFAIDKWPKRLLLAPLLQDVNVLNAFPQPPLYKISGMPAPLSRR